MDTTAPSPTLMTAPFDAVADKYDSSFTNSLIGRAQRESVWREMDRWFRPGQRVLEINCGTGVDAVHISDRGIHVVACDASRDMIAVARRRLEASTNRDCVDLRVLTIEEIGQLEKGGLYDGVLSNFAGLNCVEDLRRVARDLARLVSPGGTAILCLFGRFCLWEMLWYTFHGNLKKASRRFLGKGSVASFAPRHRVFVRYPSVGALSRYFSPHFRLVSWKGVGIAVPPSYLEPLAVRFPRLFKFAASTDPLLGGCPGVRALADHVVLVLERVDP
ncbi:MAG: class I SAM-dependent methyltransferase [Terriglobia bacterium]